MKNTHIMIIGLSSQKNRKGEKLIPLDPQTNSGKFIRLIEDNLPNLTFYKTNIVKRVPLNNLNKIRYPTNDELNYSFNSLKTEIKKINPKIIILLGRQVTEFIIKKYKINKKKYSIIKYQDKYILYIDHPSYLMIYKRKEIKKYLNKIIKLIENCF